MRVVLVNQHYAPDPAPTGRLLSDVGEALADKGHEVITVCSRRAYDSYGRPLPRQETRNGVRVIRVGGTFFSQRRRIGRVTNYLSFFALAVLQLARLKSVDVFVCLSTPPLLPAIVQRFASLRRARFVYWVMDVYPEIAYALGHLRRSSLSSRLLESAARTSIQRADAVIALGNTMANHLMKSGGRIRVVHNWGSDNIEPRPTAEHPLRNAWGWHDKFVVLYSGNFGLPHEFDTILEAAHRLQSDRHILFAFVGDGARMAATKADAERLNHPNLEFRPYVADHDLPSLLTAGDVHIVSLRNEATGLSVPSKTYNILAAGKPILFVGSEESEVANIVKELECGFRVPILDGDGLAEYINLYQLNPGLLKEHAINAHEGYQNHFTRDRGVTAISKIIEGRGVAASP